MLSPILGSARGTCESRRSVYLAKILKHVNYRQILANSTPLLLIFIHTALLKVWLEIVIAVTMVIRYKPRLSVNVGILIPINAGCRP